MPAYTRQQLQQMARDAAGKYGVPAGPFAALIQNESNWDPRAVNAKSGAMGLGQFLPSTWASRGGGQDAFDPAVNLDASARYVADLMHRNGGDLQAALMGYTGKNTAEVGRILGGVKVTDQSVDGGSAPVNWYDLMYGKGGAPTASTGPQGPTGTPGGNDYLARLPGRLHAGMLDPGLRSALNTAVGEALQRGVDIRPFITSLGRTKVEQESLYANRAKNPMPVAPPGTSNHEKGLAADIDFSAMRAEDRQTAVGALQGAGLYQPQPLKDRVHWEVSGTTPQPGQVDWYAAIYGKGSPSGGSGSSPASGPPSAVSAPPPGPTVVNPAALQVGNAGLQV